jgi:hypothetical protein
VLDYGREAERYDVARAGDARVRAAGDARAAAADAIQSLMAG